MATSVATTSQFDWTNNASTTVNNTADGLNRDAAIAATQGGYDANGNLTFDGTRTFTYDGDNRLVSETGPVTLALAYDPTGRLQQSTINGTVTNFLYDGDALAEEYNSSGSVLRRYMHGPSVDNPFVWFEGSTLSISTARYLVVDRQGSVIGYSDSTGKVPTGATYVYDAYGAPASWGGSRFRYTGQIEIPEAKLYYYKARVYDPATGRFLQTDPVGVSQTSICMPTSVMIRWIARTPQAK